MSTPMVWVTLIVCGLVTFLERGSFILRPTSKPLNPELRRALRYVAPAVFAAIVVPPVLAGGGPDTSDPWWPRLAAVAVGSAFMWRFRSMPLTLVVGMTVFWVLGALGG